MSLGSWLKSLPSLVARAAAGEAVTLVMGNEACDLDSGVCALCLAFHRSSSRPCLPLLNIRREDFPLKTELVAVLEEEGIFSSCLLFRDSSPRPLSLPSLSLALVDHNILAEEDHGLESRVVEVLDHHARETLLEEAVTIEPCGSCASLVLRTILAEAPSFTEATCLRLLRKTILLDTVCLRPEARRVTPLDVAMVERAEALLGCGAADRQEVFERVMKEKARIGHLTPGQLLRRDLKVAGGSSSQAKVALSSVPLLARDFLHLEDWQEGVADFLQTGGYGCLVVLGSQVEEEGITRDLLVGGPSPALVDLVRAGLEGSQEPGLGLGVNRESPAGILGYRHYTQANSAASRKQIMPIIKRAVL